MLTDQEFDALQEGDQCVFSAEALFDYDMANDDDVENQGAKDVKLECEQNVYVNKDRIWETATVWGDWSSVIEDGEIIEVGSKSEDVSWFLSDREDVYVETLIVSSIALSRGEAMACLTLV